VDSPGSPISREGLPALRERELQRFDELLGELGDSGVHPEGLGLLPDATRRVRLVQFNDLEALERELARGDVACVLAEAAITNAGVICPVDGFHAGLRRLTSDHGAPAGAGRDPYPCRRAGRTHRAPEPRAGRARARQVGLGRGAAGGLRNDPKVAALLELRTDASWGEQVATGGTLFANALSLAAARVTLAEVLTEDAYEHAASLGARLADGIEAVAAANGLPWRAHRLYNRSGYTHAPNLPSNATEARDSFDLELYNLQRLYMANRGVWEAIDSAGPARGIQSTADQVDRYLELLDGFMSAVTDLTRRGAPPPR
jgi:glutamate-1-semialdehyde 2,1-aminomutase